MKLKAYLIGEKIPLNYFSFRQEQGWYLPDFGDRPYDRKLSSISKQEVLNSLDKVSLRANCSVFSNKETAIKCAKARSTVGDAYFEPITYSCPLFTVFVDFSCNTVTDFCQAELYIRKHLGLNDSDSFDAEANCRWDFLSSAEETQVCSIYLKKSLKFPIIECKNEDIKGLHLAFQEALSQEQARLTERARLARNLNAASLEAEEKDPADTEDDTLTSLPSRGKFLILSGPKTPDKDIKAKHDEQTAKRKNSKKLVSLV